MTSDGETLQSGSGVLCNWSIALIKRSLSSDPVGPTFARKRRFADFTATSARPLDCGKYADDRRCRMSHRFKKR